MFIRIFTLMLMVAGSQATAQNLTQQECIEIRAAYGVWPEQCGPSGGGGAVQATPASPQVVAIGSEPSASQRQDNIFFAQGGAALDAAARAQIGQLARVLNAEMMTGACVMLVGHSDTSGGAEANREISARRAAAVRTALAPLLTDPSRIEAIQGWGEESPMANIAPTSRWQRRVEIWARRCARG